MEIKNIKQSPLLGQIVKALNEAGTGAAAIVYAAAQTKEHISQGFVALLETFLTGVLCLFTSFAIVFSGVLENQTIGQISGIELASNAFQSVLSFFPIILSVIAVLFAMSTLISWAYYGQKAWCFLFGESTNKIRIFQALYCLCIIAGSAMNFQSIINLSDAVTLFLANFSSNSLCFRIVFILAISFFTSFIFIGFSNPFVAKLNFNLNNSDFSSPSSFSSSGEDISLILLIFINITTLLNFSAYKFCFYR